jgi:hypothetical protein
MGDDETTESDDRLSHTAGAGRNSRRDNQRRAIADARGLSKKDMIAKFRNEMYNNVMPTLPSIEGYHVCWLSTTNPYDTVAWRESIGYERIRPEELPGFEHITLTSGPAQGFIGLNEMVAAKIPLDLYYEYMHIAHHERPMEHQMKMRTALETIKNQAAGDGVPIQLGDGSLAFFKEAGQPRPMFTE